jgi:DNA-binding SARP family transcriptional activator
MTERARALHRQAPEPMASRGIAWFDQNIAPVFIELGDCRTAETMLAGSQEFAAEHGEQGLATYCTATRTEVLLARGETEAAASLAETACHDAAEQGNQIALYTALRTLALAQAKQGKAREASATLDRYCAMVATWPVPVRVAASLTGARIALMAGDLTRAREALEAVAALGATERQAGFVALAQGALALAAGQPREADQCLAAAAASLEAFAIEPQLALALILRAHAQERLGVQKRVLMYLRQAGKIASGKDWVRGIARECEPAYATLETYASHYRLQGSGREFVNTLLAGATRRVWLVRQDVPMEAPLAPSSGLSDSQDQRLRFSPFGDGEIEYAGQALPLARLAGEKARELLAFAIWHGRPLARDEILDALWDGMADEATLSTLRKASYQIRRFLGADAWRRAGETYVLAPAVDDDYRSMLTIAVGLEDGNNPAAEVATLAARGLSLYTGPYLQWCYSDWSEAPRSLAQAAVMTVIEALTDARLQLGQPLAALEAAERGLAIEPQRESVRRSHIRILAQLGRPAEAIESYKRHLRILSEEELGAPSPELRRLAGTISHPVLAGTLE